MDRLKRKKILKILKSGHSAVNISSQIGRILNEPEEDIVRILQNSDWDRKIIFQRLNRFPGAK